MNIMVNLHGSTGLVLVKVMTSRLLEIMMHRLIYIIEYRQMQMCSNRIHLEIEDWK